MLKQRIITAVVLASVLLAALFGLSPIWFSLFAAGFIMIAAWEWGNLSAAGRPLALIYYVVVATSMVALVYFGGFLQESPHLELIKKILLAGCVWWAVALLWVQGYPSSALIWGSRPARLFMGLFVLIPPWLGLAWLIHQPAGPWLVVVLVLTVACADIGAYFAGRAFGRHKLAPQVSPGKTVEGFAGGVLAVVAVISVVLVLSPSQRPLWFQWGLVAVGTVLAAVLGDLLESMVKRHRGVKDSGSILPGHGGLLDRLDSLTAAIPVFTLLYILLIYPAL